MPLSLRDANYRLAKYYCELAKQLKADGDRERIQVEGNIFHGAEIAEQLEDYAMLVDYVRSISDVWAGSEWDQYKHFVYLVLEKGNVSLIEKIKYLTNLIIIENAQGNYELAKKLLEEKFSLLLIVRNEIDNFDLFEVAMQIVKLAVQQDNFENLESILSQALEVAIEENNLRQEADLLRELALLPEIKTRYETAVEYLTRGLELANRIRYKVGIIDILTAKVSICIFHKRFPEARVACEEALYLAESINDRHRLNKIKKQQRLIENAMNKKIFISYNHADRNFVEKLAKNLQNAGLSVWWDEWEIKVGDSIVQKVSNGITTSAYLLVILSPDSVNSEWVQREISSAMMKQLSRKNDITILPLLLKDCDVPVLLTDIRWADFRKSYKSGLTELLKALR